MPASRAIDDLERVLFATRTGWRRWLAANHTTRTGVWLRFYRKSSRKPGLRYDEAVEEALCHGWIDSIVRSLDDESYVQLFTPRKPTSAWSRTNKARVERLISAGLMTDAGLERIEAARRNGSWTRLDSVEALEVPEDFRRALARNRKARAIFQTLSPSRKKQLLYGINTAKRPETRKKRIREAVIAAAANRPS